MDLPAPFAVSDADCARLPAVSCADSKTDLPVFSVSFVPERVLSPIFWVADLSLSSKGTSVLCSRSQLSQQAYQAEQHQLPDRRHH